MSTLTISDIIWATLLVLFLALEIPAALHVVPWDTLSRTSWLNEQRYPLLRTALFGFLIGLAVHIRFEVGLWKATVGGIAVALVYTLWAA